MTLRFVFAALGLALASSSHSNELVMRVGGAAGSAAVDRVVHAPAMRLDAASTSRVVRLGSPTAIDEARFRALKRAVSNAAGFGRDVAANERRIELASLVWTSSGDGGRVARVEVASEGASSLRAALRMPGVAGMLVRFAAGDATNAIQSVAATEIAGSTVRFGEYWSPMIDGERLAIELEAAPGVTFAGATVDIVRVSHFVDPMFLKTLTDIGTASACHAAEACPLGGGSWANSELATVTAKLVATSASGTSVRCTATLLNDSAASSTPYLYTAGHCVPGAYEAQTLQAWWHFKATACGNATVGAYAVQTGAALLGRSQDGGWALVRLSSAPPPGVTFSPWDAAPLPLSNPDLFFTHHAHGDLLTYAVGTRYGESVVNFGTAAGGSIPFTRFDLAIGGYEPGTDGASIRNFGNLPKGSRGVVYGGTGACGSPTDSLYYSPLGVMLPLVRQYLTPSSQVAELVVSVEYYHANLDHFFMTIDPAEVAGLDNGTIVGWERTGFRFLACNSPGAGRSPVCRFYRKPEFGDSHFFTADPAECARVQVDYATDWFFENPAIYYVSLPNTTTGACPAGTKPIYRFLNLAEINHRFTTEQTVAIELSNTPGWQAEGYGPGPLYPVMCSPVGS